MLSRATDYLSVFKTATRERWDAWTPVALMLLGCIGVAFIYSAQFTQVANDWWKQVVWLIGGAGIYLAVSLVDYRLWLSVWLRQYRPSRIQAYAAEESWCQWR